MSRRSNVTGGLVLSLRLAVGLAVGLGATGCVEVRPWQRGELARRPLRQGVQSDVAEDRFEQHARGAREGAEGGYGSAGGGCGCN
jgi:hypothetical protein